MEPCHSGKSRSSLRLNDDITAGYDAAREFLKTPQGKNLFQKAQKKKLEGTGADLTRAMDKKRADINATESTEAIVKKLMAATNRANLFRGIASEDATPGAQKLVSLFPRLFLHLRGLPAQTAQPSRADIRRIPGEKGQQRGCD